MSSPSQLAPWPFHAVLDSLGVMLIPDPQTHAIAVATKVKPWENVAPQDYSYGIIPPDIEQATEFRRVLMGMGERREQFKILRRYLYADGVDPSINGTPMLGPGMTTVTPALTGSVGGWYEALSGGVLKEFILAGRYVLVGNGDLTDADDWTVSKDFGGGVIAVHARRFLPAGYPVRTISNATNATPIVVTATAHGFTTGQTVTITGVGGNTAANGTFVVTVVDANSFSLNASVGSGAYTSGGVATQAVTLKDSLYVTTSNHHLWVYDGTSDTTVWTDLTATLHVDPANQKADFLETHGGVLFRAWDNKVCSVSADPAVAANWNAVIQIGDASQPITWLLEISGTLFIFKADGSVWDVSAAGIANPLFGPRGTPSATNAQQAIVWGNLGYVPIGDSWYSLGPNTSGVIEMHPIGVERFIENDSPVSGAVVAADGFNLWFLYFALYNAKTSASYLMKYGSWFVDDQPPLGSSAFVRSTAIFNPLSAGGSFMEPVINGAIVSFPGKRITSMHVTAISTPNQRLYIGFADGDHAWTTLPRGGPNPTADPNCTYQASGSLYYATHTMNFPSVMKAYRGATVFGMVLDATRTAELLYRTAPTGSFTSVGTFETPGQRIDLPAGVSGAQVDLQLHLAGPGTSTPWLEGFAWHETIRPDLLLERTLPIMARDRIARLDGATDWHSAEQVRQTLQGLANAKSTIAATLPDGKNATLLIGDYAEALASTDGSFGLSWDITLKMVEFASIIQFGTIDRLVGESVDSLSPYTIDQLGDL